jgi:hypothetical protein
MPEGTRLKPCSYFLVRYVPNLAREEFLNIGLLVHSPEEDFLDCLFTDDWRRIKRFHPQADAELLRELQPHFEQQIKEHEDKLDEFLREMQESYSNLIQVTPSRPCLLREPQAEMQALFERYVGARLAGPAPQDTRMRIRQRLTDALRRHGVLDLPRFEKRIPASQWTEKGDPFCFDFGYRPLAFEGKPDGHVKLVHALSLKRDNEIAHVLANTLRYVRRREPAELTAVVEGLPAPGDETALHSQRILRDAEVELHPLAEVDAYAQTVRSELAA